jgi:hypothetical protein
MTPLIILEALIQARHNRLHFPRQALRHAPSQLVQTSHALPVIDLPVDDSQRRAISLMMGAYTVAPRDATKSRGAVRNPSSRSQ